jgi:hypothetical protein
MAGNRELSPAQPDSCWIGKLQTPMYEWILTFSAVARDGIVDGRRWRFEDFAPPRQGCCSP